MREPLEGDGDSFGILVTGRYNHCNLAQLADPGSLQPNSASFLSTECHVPLGSSWPGVFLYFFLLHKDRQHSVTTNAFITSRKARGNELQVSDLDSDSNSCLATACIIFNNAGRSMHQQSMATVKGLILEDTFRLFFLLLRFSECMSVLFFHSMEIPFSLNQVYS